MAGDEATEGAYSACNRGVTEGERTDREANKADREVTKTVREALRTVKENHAPRRQGMQCRKAAKVATSSSDYSGEGLITPGNSNPKGRLLTLIR